MQEPEAPESDDDLVLFKVSNHSLKGESIRLSAVTRYHWLKPVVDHVEEH